MQFTSRSPRRSVWPVVRTGLFTLLTGMLLLTGAVTAETWAFADSLADDEKLLPGTTIGGVDVGGLNAADAARLVEAPLLNRSVELRLEDQRWTVTARQIGASTDVDEAVDAALGTARAAGWTELARIRWFDERPDPSGEITLTVPRAQIAALVDEIAAEIDIAAVDAELDFNDGWVQIHDEREGRRLDRDRGVDRAVAALHDGGGTVELTTDEVHPEVTREDFSQVLLLRKSDFRVYLYEDGEIAKSWPVAIGRWDAPTPTGVFEVGLKRRSPTWVNPAPNGWGRGMPLRIGPGPSNPLGLRAVNWNTLDGNDTLIRFHGTPNVASIGNPASQGCVRMTNTDVVDLFNRVETGATIVSLHG